MDVRLVAGDDGRPRTDLNLGRVGPPVGPPVRPSLSTRWEADGEVSGEGREVMWRPASRSDQLRLAVRTDDGVAVVSLRAREVPAG
jgi:hypothetical protein